ncbi:hypothetical protein [Salegentibacter sp. F14]
MTTFFYIEKRGKQKAFSSDFLELKTFPDMYSGYIPNIDLEYEKNCITNSSLKVIFDSMNPIELKFEIELPDLKYLGRGPSCIGSNEWSTNHKFVYRCANCDDTMNASWKNDWTCSCQAMALDSGAARFGSFYGDENILVYRKIRKTKSIFNRFFKT